MNHIHLHFKSLDSTNDFLLNLIKEEKVEEGLWVTCSHQTRGRGQRSKEWIGEPDLNFYASLYLEPHFLKIDDQYQLNIAICLAVRSFIQEHVSAKVMIKWPNDILIDRKKLCGILIENAIQSGKFESSVVGIGINVNQRSFSERGITSIALESENDIPIDSVLSGLRNYVESYYQKLKIGEDLKAEYLRHLFGYRESIRIRFKEEDMQGQITDIDLSGCMLFRAEGVEKRFCSGEISFLL